MRGQVIDGLYKGWNVYQSENNTFTIHGPDGQIIPVSQNTASSVADISHNYPGFGSKTYMVRWKQDAVSVMQLFPEQIQPEATERSKPQKTSKHKIPLGLLVLVLVAIIGLGIALVSGALHRHSWQDATCQTPRICADCGETAGKRLEHIPGDWSVKKKGSYGIWGTEVQCCTECGFELGSRSYLPDAYVGDLYVCSADEFQQRLELWLKEAGLTYTTELTDEEGEMLSIQIKESGSIQAIVCFIDRNDSVITGQGSGRVNASSVCLAFQEDSTVQEQLLIPPLIACCNNRMELSSAETLSGKLRTQRRLDQEGVRYLWGNTEGLDYLFLGFDAVPDSLQNLPSLPYENNAKEKNGSGILYTPNGGVRNASEFIISFTEEELPISREFGKGQMHTKYLEELDNYAFGLIREGVPGQTVIAFGNAEGLLKYNTEFNEIYMRSATDDSDRLDAFAFDSAVMVHLVDPTMGDVQTCAKFLEQMIDEMDENNTCLKEINGITYYMAFRDDGDVSLVICF